MKSIVAHDVVCPNCNGRGKIIELVPTTRDTKPEDEVKTVERICPVCLGTKTISVFGVDPGSPKQKTLL